MNDNTIERSVKFHAVAFVFRLLWKLGKVLVRFAFGAALDGHRSTNATFLSDGTEETREPSFWGLGKPTRWAYMAGYKRAFIRWLCVTALVVAVVWPDTFRTIAVPTLGIALGVAVWRAVEAIRMWRHNHRYLYPLHTTLSGRLGVSPNADPADWLSVPVNFHDDDAEIVVDLPADYARETDDLVRRIVTSKLGLAADEMQANFKMVGAEPYVVFTHAPHAPDLVPFADVRELLEKQPESAPLIGLGRRGNPISADFEAEAPHTLVSMASGAGKSMLAKGQIAQVLHNGGQVVILDIKRHSHKWARGLPGVLYLRDIEDIHNALVWLAVEAERRNVIADEIDEPDFTRLFVVAEEMNATIKKLRRHWAKIRKNKSDPSPAVEGLADLTFMGRAVKVNVLAIAQYGTANTFGGPETRENFSNRILGKYTVNAWRMLVPEVWPMPKSSEKPGRVQVVLGSRAEETQVLKWSDAEAREWAESGVPSQSPKLALTMPAWADEVGTVPGGADALAESPMATVEPIADADAGLVTLREAAETGVVGVADHPTKALEILRSASKRDDEFPEHAGTRGQAKVYRIEELQRWQRNRPRRPVGSDPENEQIDA